MPVWGVPGPVPRAKVDVAMGSPLLNCVVLLMKKGAAPEVVGMAAQPDPGVVVYSSRGCQLTLEVPSLKSWRRNRKLVLRCMLLTRESVSAYQSMALNAVSLPMRQWLLRTLLGAALSVTCASTREFCAVVSKPR